ncbi:hypothetical protein DTO046C5_2320 [Penicillium roqueforti]|nr:hypothetical protein DTO046C5_2320 [Penicillium roqueforti]KAI3179374.1 hypothetical protein DTO032C6_9060 [Penicillium roqueforti]
MSNIIHKVKDAVTGHHHDESKTSSSKTDDTRDTYGSSDRTTDNTFNRNTSTGAGSNTYGSGSGPGYETSSTTGAGGHGSGTGTGTGTIHDSRKGPIDVGPGTSENYGSNTAGGYGSSNTGSSKINAGPHDSKLANKADPRVDSDLDNRGSTNTFGSGTGRSSEVTDYGSNDKYGSTTGHSAKQTDWLRLQQPLV